MTAAERVAAGVAFLDAGLSGWAARIDVTLLDLTSQNRCILGQLFGRYAFAPVDYRLNVDRGFKATSAEDALLLTSEWRRVVEERQAVVNAE